MASTNRNGKPPQLHQVIGILKEKRDSLAAGRCRLTLTAGLAWEICSALYSSPRRLSSADEGLSTILTDVKAVRVVTDPDCHESINLSPFHHVTHLEVRSVGVSLISGLSKLRSQLKSLVLHACLENGCLDEALIQCGGDMSQDSFLWSELQSLYVTSCAPLDMGSGLQLAPWLKILDLSFNGLSDNGIHSLATLLTLQSLSLDFNLLQRIPSLAPSARSTLKVLHLRQNQLDSLRGLEQLSGLEELDAGYNCLSSSESVSALCSLGHLVRLCLEFNPISYSKDYRLLVLRRVASSVNKKKFTLDGLALSGPEKDAVGTMASLYSSTAVQTLARPALRPHIEVTNASVREETVPAEVEEMLASLEKASTPAGTSSAGPVQSTPVRSSSNLSVGFSLSATSSSVKKRKAREVEIAEADPAPSLSPVPVPSADSPTRRLHLPVEERGNETNASNSEHLTTKQQLEELRRTFGQDNWLHSQAGNQVRQLLGWNEVEVSPDREPRDSQAEFLTLPNDLAIQQEDSNREDEIVVLEQPDPSLLQNHSVLNIISDGDKDDETEEENEEDQEDEEEMATDVHVFLVRRQPSGEERLLTISSTQVSEKNTLTGRTVASWQRSSVLSAVLLTPPSESSWTHFQLQFSRGSGGQQPPVYTVEEDDFSELGKLLTVEDKIVQRGDKIKAENGRERPLSPDELSCMKCDNRFPSFKAAVKLRTVTSPLSNTNGHRQNSPHPTPAKGQLEEYSVCPFCGSDMIFAVQRTAQVKETDSSEPVSSSSDGSSDVVAAVEAGDHRPNQLSPSRSNHSLTSTSSTSSSDDSSGSSEAGSVEVVDKTLPRPSMPSLFMSGKRSFSLKPFCTPPTTASPSVAAARSSETPGSTKSASSVSSKSSGGRSKNSSIAATSHPLPPPTPVFTYSYADFSQVDHRLRLYCEMFLLGHQAEEFHGLIKAELVTPVPAGYGGYGSDGEMAPLPVLLVVTSHKLYFLKITGTPSEQPEKWLNLESSYSLSQLTGMCPIIGHQGLALQLGPSQQSAGPILLLKDQRRTKNVAHFLMASLEKSGLIVPSMPIDLAAAQWSAMDGLVRGHQEGEEENGVTFLPNSAQHGVFLFSQVRLEYGSSTPAQQLDNIAVMVTSDRMALISGDPRWMLLGESGLQFRRWGVALLSLQQIVNLISLESFVNHPEQLRCYFLDEASNLEEKWTVQLATREAVDQLIEAVRTPWEAMFSVELEINELDE